MLRQKVQLSCALAGTEPDMDFGTDCCRRPAAPDRRLAAGMAVDTAAAVLAQRLAVVFLGLEEAESC